MVSVKLTRSAPYHLLPFNLNESTRPPIPNEMTCKICYKEKIDILFIPCGHLFACLQCAVTLHECAICREPFCINSYALKVSMEEEVCVNESLTSVDIGQDSSNSNAMCRVCKVESIGTVFVPCLHVYTCYQCAITSDSCPVCSKEFFGLIQVFL